MFVEVQSDTYESTIRKLCFVLMVHLIYLRTGKVDVTESRGIVFPKVETKHGISIVMVVWMAERFRFCFSICRVQKIDWKKIGYRGG